MTALLYILPALIFGFLLGYLWHKNQSNQEALNIQQKGLEAEKERIKLQERLDRAIEVFQTMKQELDLERTKKEHIQSELATAQTQKIGLEEKLALQLKEVQELQQKFTLEFKNLAQDILKSNTQQFSEANQKQMQDILSPLKEKIQLFEKRVNDVHTEETKQRSELKQQILSLMDASKTISTDAQNLTKALKGESKTQGNWGEMILEKILEYSGLTKGIEYQLQFSDTNQEGKRIQPDAVIFLPDDKNIIIDAKVSLVDYEKLVSEEIPEKRQEYLKAHLQSIRSHIKNLHSKDYISSSQLRQPDFILLFMPIEGAFSVAMQEDNSIYQEAWDKQIVIVSPTTLLATLKTIDFIWTQEKQTKNAQEIARQAGNLYEKFVGFLEDLQRIERGISNAKTAFDDAKKKLIDGRGNIVQRVENLRQLGAKSNDKVIPSDFLPHDSDLV